MKIQGFLFGACVAGCTQRVASRLDPLLIPLLAGWKNQGGFFFCGYVFAFGLYTLGGFGLRLAPRFRNTRPAHQGDDPHHTTSLWQKAPKDSPPWGPLAHLGSYL